MGHLVRFQCVFVCLFIALGFARSEVTNRRLQIFDDVAECLFGEAAIIPSRNASCMIYPEDGLCASYFAGKSVYIYNDITFDQYEAILKLTLDDARILKDIANGDNDDPCYQEAARTQCIRFYYECNQLGDEPVPILPCVEACEDYWNTCEDQSILYYQFVLNQDPTDSKLVTCNVSIENLGITWNNNGVFDVFGGRVIPGQFLYPEGYLGQPIFPDSQALYNLSNGTLIPVACNPSPRVEFIEQDQNQTECTYPFVLSSSGTSCVLECPVYIFSTEQYQAIYWAHVVPMLPGFFMCLFVFVDSLVFILSGRASEVISYSTHHIRRLYKKDLTDSQSDSYHVSKKNELKAANLYAFIGSFCGPLYFCIGPILVAIDSYDARMGCPGGLEGFTVEQLALPIEESFTCKVNRNSIFLLLIVQNVIVFAICRLHMVVVSSLRFGHIPIRSRVIFNSMLAIYCIFVPIVCWITALMLDDPGFTTEKIYITLSRWSLTCGPRLTDTEEFILIFTPLIFSSAIIVVVSLDIARTTRGVQRRRSDFKRKRSLSKGSFSGAFDKSDNTDASLRKFQGRLIILGAITTSLFILYTVATVTTLPKFESLAVLINEFITCSTLSALCQPEDCVFPDDSQGRPSAGLIALQQACLSLTPAVFGLFFMLTALDRRRRKHTSESNHQKNNLGDSSKPSKQQSDEMIASNNVKTEAPSEKLISTQAPPRPKEEFPETPKTELNQDMENYL